MIFGRVMMFSLEMDVEKRICLAQKKKKKKKKKIIFHAQQDLNFCECGREQGSLKKGLNKGS